MNSGLATPRATDEGGHKSALKYAERDLKTLTYVVREYVRDKKVCVQAGGNLGVFPCHLAVPFNSVYSFEPDPALFREMVKRCPENVVCLNAAVGCERELVSAVRARRDGNTKREAHVGVTHVVPGGFIPTIKIDDLGLRRCDFLCLDVEGYEFSALVGAQQTIESGSPVIMIELNGSAKSLGVDDEDIRTHLRMLGYTMVERIHSDEIYVRRSSAE